MNSDIEREKLKRRIAAVKFAEAVDRLSGNNVPADPELAELNKRWISGEIDGEDLLDAVRTKWKKGNKKNSSPG